MKLSIIVPSLTGEVPESVKRAAAGRAEVEIVVVKGVSPVGKARNEGLGKAKGEYIAWVDSDDEVTEDWLDEILNTIIHPSSPTPQQLPEVITFDAELVGWNLRKAYVWGISEKVATMERLQRDLCRDMERPSAPWLYVTKRILWKGLEFDESIELAEDYVLMPQLMLRAKSCAYIPKKLYRYIHRASSLVNSCDERQRVRLMAIMEESCERLPPPFRRKRLWGLALQYFWGRINRDFVRKHFWTLVGETMFGPDLTLWDRLKTTLRFLWFSCGGGK